jgi:hypothetical protein
LLLLKNEKTVNERQKENTKIVAKLEKLKIFLNKIFYKKKLPSLLLSCGELLASKL